MKKFYKWLLYGVYALGVATFFLYYLFPSEAVKRYIITRMNMLNPELRVAIADITPILSPGLKLHSVQLGSRSGNMMDAEEVVLIPNILSLFSDRPSYRFSINAFGGSIEGQAFFESQKPREQIEIDANIADIRLEMVRILQHYSGNRLNGICSGNIQYKKGPGQGRDMTTRLSATDVSLALKTPVFGMESLTFDNVETEAVLRNRNLKIKHLVVHGNQFDGSFSGSAVIRQELNESPLNLNGMITPQAEFMQGTGVKISGSPVGGDSTGDGQIPVRISGPLDNVSLSFK
jgi:type II secretion system protein N